MPDFTLDILTGMAPTELFFEEKRRKTQKEEDNAEIKYDIIVI